jgi:hypothetical protein
LSVRASDGYYRDMTRHSRAWFFAALATLLGPFVLSDGAATTATEVRTTVAPAPVEEESYAVADASPIVLPASTSGWLPEASLAGWVSAPAESPPPRPVTAAGVDHPDLPGSEPFRTLHPARGPPSIS